MNYTSLYDCFEQHLLNLQILDETEDLFVTAVVEIYLVSLGGAGFHFFNQAEDTYTEIRDEVTDMLRKKIYGHANINHYREEQRSKSQSA